MKNKFSSRDERWICVKCNKEIKHGQIIVFTQSGNYHKHCTPANEEVQSERYVDYSDEQNLNK